MNMMSYKLDFQKLIESVREEEALYNPKDPDYKNNAVLRSLWTSIGYSVGLDGRTAKKKWWSKRDHYIKLRNLKTKSGKPSEKLKRWKWYPYLKFLDSFVEDKRAGLAVSGGHLLGYQSLYSYPHTTDDLEPPTALKRPKVEVEEVDDGGCSRRRRTPILPVSQPPSSASSAELERLRGSPQRSIMSSPAPSPASNNHYAKISGVPCPATPTRYTAPVHIDVGGTIYTSSLETLTKFPESKLAKMFNGSIPIILDSLKQHYFIDRDGEMFRHVLNFLRTSHLVLPETFSEVDLLLEEARFYDITAMVKSLEDLKKNIKKENDYLDCIAVNISPDLGERISISAERSLLEEVFPELNSALMDSRNSGWNMDNRFVIRFPINGFCKLNSVQVLQRLLNQGFSVMASNGGGVEGQQFSEYLFAKKASNNQ